MPIIEVENLSKDFTIYKQSTGKFHLIKDLFHRDVEIKRAIHDISFNIEKGDVVGYVGPNGAGKSTTIKILTGILVPTSGRVLVNDRIPYENRRENAMKIGVVFGQRSQLYWDLPMKDTFDLYKKMYRIDDSVFTRNVRFYIDMLNMGDFLHRPVRQLSLGEKMRAEFAVALLHDPEIVYLDEPTIGLDIISKKNIRDFIRQINREKQTTIILTTHDMEDIEQVCNRIILIDKGKKQYDGSLTDFKSAYRPEHVIEFTFSKRKNPHCKISTNLIHISYNNDGCGCAYFDPNVVTSMEVINFLMCNFVVSNIKTVEPKIEDILRTMYAGK